MPPAIRVIGRTIDGPIHRPRRRAGPLLGGLLVVALIGAAVLGVHGQVRHYRDLRSAATLLAEAELGPARRLYLGLLNAPLFRAAAHDGLGMIAVLEGDEKGGAAHFAAAGNRAKWLTPLGQPQVVLRLIEEGRYEPARTLAEQATKRDDSPASHMLLGLALNGLDDLSGAREEMAGGALRSVFERVRRRESLLLGGVFRDERVLSAYASHVHALIDKERTGRRAYLLDDEGEPLFEVSVQTQKPDRVPASLRAALAGPDGKGGLESLLEPRDRRNVVEVTLDRSVQVAAHNALRHRRGAIVVLGTDGAVLAAAARDEPRRQGRAAVPEGEAPDPLVTVFDPASVAKLVTLAAALATPGLVGRSFPYDCGAPLKIDDKPFYDWRRHGEVDGPERALAVSCNLSFARLALGVGREALRQTFADFGFIAPDAEPRSQLALGRLTEAIGSDRDQANLGIGEGCARTSLAGAAAIALAVARDGELVEPWVVRRKRSIAGKAYLDHQPVTRRVVSPEVARGVRDAMLRAVADEDGTGKRAQHPVMTLAAKTGTAGTYKTGYRLTFVGFTPVEAPRYAFAIHLRDTVSRAEWDAAQVAKALLEGLQEVEEARKRKRKSPW